MIRFISAWTLMISLSGGITFAETMTKTSPSSGGNQFGVGVVLGDGAGLSLYGDTDIDHFVQAGMVWGPLDTYSLTADYAFAYRHAISSMPIVTPYWGLGLAVVRPGVDSWYTRYDEREQYRTDFGLRLPLGLNIVIPRTPVQLGVELAPTLLVAPATYSYLQGDLHARLLF